MTVVDDCIFTTTSKPVTIVLHHHSMLRRKCIYCYTLYSILIDFIIRDSYIKVRDISSIRLTISSCYLSTFCTSLGSFPTREGTFHVPITSFGIWGLDRQGPCFQLPHNPYSTEPLWFLLWVVGPSEDRPMSPFRAEPDRTPWTKARPQGTCLRSTAGSWYPSHQGPFL